MKSHFRFSKKQRNGIFLFVVVVLVLQILIYYFSSKERQIHIENWQLEQWRQEVDSLVNLSLPRTAPKLLPFNPNFISDFKGYTLGMTIDEIDALHKFRSQGKWINSNRDFQKVTGVSNKWLDSISPFFKFPDWIVESSKQTHRRSQNSEPKSYQQKTDLNSATAKQLEVIYGVGPVLSKRIIEYRNQLEGGFAADIELTEVYGIKDSTFQGILEEFTVKTPRKIIKIDINKANRDQLVTVPYIDYELAYQIIEYRTLHEGIRKIEELTKIDDFPEKKIKLIGLYLQF